jgi:hypothetical protein
MGLGEYNMNNKFYVDVLRKQESSIITESKKPSNIWDAFSEIDDIDDPINEPVSVDDDDIGFDVNVDDIDGSYEDRVFNDREDIGKDILTNIAKRRYNLPDTMTADELQDLLDDFAL